MATCPSQRSFRSRQSRARRRPEDESILVRRLRVTCRLTFVRATHLQQCGLHSPPSLGLLLVSSILKGHGFLSGHCDGFGTLCFEKVACNCRNISCIRHSSPPQISHAQLWRLMATTPPRILAFLPRLATLARSSHPRVIN